MVLFMAPFSFKNFFRLRNGMAVRRKETIWRIVRMLCQLIVANTSCKFEFKCGNVDAGDSYQFFRMKTDQTSLTFEVFRTVIVRNLISKI